MYEEKIKTLQQEVDQLKEILKDFDPNQTLMSLTTLAAILMTLQIRMTCLMSSSPQRLRNCRPSNVPSLKASCRMQSELLEPTTNHMSKLCTQTC